MNISSCKIVGQQSRLQCKQAGYRTDVSQMCMDVLQVDIHCNAVYHFTSYILV